MTLRRTESTSLKNRAHDVAVHAQGQPDYDKSQVPDNNGRAALSRATAGSSVVAMSSDACALPLRWNKRVQGGADQVGGVLISGRHPGCVGAQRHIRVRVSKSSGDRPNVDAAGDELRRDEVAEVMQANAVQPRSSSETLETMRHDRRMPRS